MVRIVLPYKQNVLMLVPCKFFMCPPRLSVHLWRLRGYEASVILCSYENIYSE